MTPGREQQPALEAQRGLVVQQLLPPAADDVLGDVDGDHAARVGVPDLGGVVDDRADQLAVGRVEDLERHVDVALVPLLQQPAVSSGLGGDVTPSRTLGRVALAKASARSVGLWSLETRTIACTRVGQDLVVVVRRELGGDAVVVAADPAHDQEEDDHREDRDPCAGEELRESTITRTTAVKVSPIALMTRSAAYAGARPGPPRSPDAGSSAGSSRAG